MMIYSREDVKSQILVLYILDSKRSKSWYFTWPLHWVINILHFTHTLFVFHNELDNDIGRKCEA